MAAGRDVLGEQFKVAAVIGDGSMGSGLAYEGLNNAGHSDRDIIVVLNDNEMSIAPNVGAMHKYLTSIQRNPLYNRLRSRIGDIVDNAPAPFAGVSTLVRKWEESVKSLLTPGVLLMNKIGSPAVRNDTPECSPGRYPLDQMRAEANAAADLVPSLAEHREAIVQATGGVVLANRQGFRQQHVAGVQPRVHLHDGDAGLGIPGLDGAVDGRSAAPAWQDGLPRLRRSRAAIGWAKMGGAP